MAKQIVYFILFVALCNKGIWCEDLHHEPQSVSSEDKIVGGTDAAIQSYPYQAYLLLSDGRDNFECGGSIISEFYIVTAAHCLARIRSINVRIGSADKFNGGTTYNASAFTSHPLYDDVTSDYDIGIVTVDVGMDLDGINARAITLARVGSDPPENRFLTITGWGNTAEGAAVSSTILQVAQVPVVNRENCSASLGVDITSRMLCAGYTEGGVDTCQGDSGGPAVLATNGRLVGVTSFGFGCARPNSPGVYTAIGNYHIRSYIYLVTGV